jgi:hypothetical protein
LPKIAKNCQKLPKIAKNCPKLPKIAKNRFSDTKFAGFLNTKFMIHFFNKPGVDVMITIICDFCQFSAKKLAFFSKANVMITIFSKTSSSLSKNPNIFLNFSAKIF